MRLQPTQPGTPRRFVGRYLVALLATGAFAAAPGALAELAGSAPTYMVEMALDAGGEQSSPRVLAKAGEKFAVASGQWRIEMTVRPGQAQGEVWLAGKLFNGPDVVSAPTLLTRLGERATIKVGDANRPVTLSMIVSPQS